MSRPHAWRIASGLAALALAAGGLLVWLNLRGESKLADTRPALQDAALVERGAYLARAGNCMACHTEPGGAP